MVAGLAGDELVAILTLAMGGEVSAEDISSSLYGDTGFTSPFRVNSLHPSA
jgi:hypothetical protein